MTEKVILTTVSDDRWGRKNGLYEITQFKISHIINNNPQLGIAVQAWRWKDIEATEFYQNNKILLDNKDAGRNGRAYKPFVILDALNKANFGDFVIYTDCSPEVWNLDENIKLDSTFNLRVIKGLTIQNNDILTVLVKWDSKDIKDDELGVHIHKHFTLNRCMKVMELERYENSLIHASGMWCIRKTEETVKFVETWLHYNLIDQCCSLGKADVPNDTSYWEEERDFKVGHRHDQSISGLLINRRNGRLIDILYNEMNPYNFLQFCRTDENYKFVDSNKNLKDTSLDLTKVFIRPGSIVINQNGIELKVFRIEERDEVEYFVVGKVIASCYETTREFLTLKKEETIVELTTKTDKENDIET